MKSLLKKYIVYNPLQIDIKTVKVRNKSLKLKIDTDLYFAITNKISKGSIDPAYVKNVIHGQKKPGFRKFIVKIVIM